jgi:tetratricopeptide (TPR) repeat protein
LLCAAPAAAQTSPHDRALALFAQSGTEYDAGRFDRAIELLREAYSLEPDPILLYNMARAYEGAGRTDEAIDAYERYLAGAGEVRDRGAIETRLTTLRAQQARERELQHRSVRPVEHRPPPPPAPSIDPAPWIVLAVGVAGVGAGVVLGVFSQDAHAQAVDEMIHERAFSLQQSAYDFATGANVSFIAGGVIALAGAIWGIVAIATSSSGPRTAIRSNGIAITF